MTGGTGYDLCITEVYIITNFGLEGYSMSILGKLRELAEIDGQLVALKRKIDAGPKELEMQQQHCDAVKAARSEIQEACMRCATEIDTLGLEVKSLENEAKDLDQKIGIIKNSKEYKIITERIKDVKKNIGDYESKEIALMEELEGLKKVLEEKNAQLEEEELKLESVEKANKSDAKSIKAEQLKLVQERKTKIADIQAADREAIDIYNKALARGKGYAVAELKNSACQKCFRKVSPSLENIVIAHRSLDKVICPGCGRLLFVLAEAN